MHEIFTLRNLTTMKGCDFTIKNEDKEPITLLIPKSISESHEYSNYALTVYCLLQELSVPTQLPMQCITCNQLAYYLTGEICQQRNKITDYIKCGINELEEKGIITKYKEFSKHYILDCQNLWIDTDSGSFTKIFFDEVQQIFSIKSVNNFTLLRYFVFIIGTLNWNITVYLANGEYKNGIVGNFTIDYIAEKVGISTRSAIEYNKILEKEKLLYVYRQKDFVIDEENNIKSLSNIYGRYCDMEYIETFARNQKEYKQSYRYKKNNQEVSNNKRRLAQMYQQLLKKRGEKYTEQEIREIYEYVLDENEKYNRMYEKSKCEEYLDKIRDTDIFDKYEFLTEK